MLKRNSPVATSNTVPFTSTRHPTVLGVGVVEKLAGERYDGLCRVAARDPGAFGAAGRVVDDRAAAVGRGRGGSGALLGELLGPAVHVPGERVGLLVGVARVVVHGEAAAAAAAARDGECTTFERIEARVGIVAGTAGTTGIGIGAGTPSAIYAAGWRSVGWNGGRGMVVVVVVMMVVVIVGMWWWHSMSAAARRRTGYWDCGR